MLFIILLSVPLELGTVLGTMRCKIFLPLLLFTVVTASLPAQAQVQRCTDARTGKVTYTDGSCSADQRSQEVVPALSPQEKAAQERQYEEAQARWQLEQARTQAQRQLEAEKAAAQAAAAAARQPPVQIDSAARQSCCTCGGALSGVPRIGGGLSPPPPPAATAWQAPAARARSALAVQCVSVLRRQGQCAARP